MIARFTLVGRVAKIHPRYCNARGESIALTLGEHEEDEITIITAGKVCETVDTKVSIGDILYVEGRLRKDCASRLDTPKNVLLLHVNHMTIIEGQYTHG